MTIVNKLLLILLLSSCFSFIQAEENNVSDEVEFSSGSIQLEDISIVDEAIGSSENIEANNSYESFDAVESGLSLLLKESVGITHQGGLDTTELLKVLPFVQMDIERYTSSGASEQHIRPSDFSISGGSYYDNNIMVDGISINSVFDVTQSANNENVDEVNGQTTQTLYVDPSLLEAVEVQDSNISAEYGSFNGGTVDYQVREAKDEFKASFNVGFQSDEMVSYLGEDADGDPKPDYIKYQTSMSFDLPLTDKLKVLAAYSRTESESYYLRSEEYGYEEYTNGDISENIFLKATYDINENLRVKSMLMYSPYESEYTADDDYDSERLSESTGFATYLELSGYHYNYDWSGRLSYNKSDASRDWDGDRYKWDADSEYGSSLCDSDRHCNEGGFGDIEQTQEDYVLKLTASPELDQGTLNLGADFTYTQAYKARNEPSWYYYESTVDSNKGFVCANGDDACMSDIAFTKGVLYDNYEADIGVYRHTLWSSYQRDIGPVNIRTGLRYEYDDFLNNHNLAPRFNSSWEVYPESFISFGANRYYAGNVLAYAIKSATPTSTTYSRGINTDGTLTEWAYDSTGTAYNFSDGSFDTPYSDEVTLAFTLPTVLDGIFRVKGVKRWTRDKFSISREVNVQGDYDYTTSNDGETDYHGVSLEWSVKLGSHTLTANTTWSETINNGGATDYFSETDIEDLEETYVYYDGRILSEYDLYALEGAENYAAPIKAHLSWMTTWWNDRILTNVTFNYRGEYTGIDDTGESIAVNGVSYDIYEEEVVSAYTEINFNAQMEVYRTTNISTIVDMKITNLFNENPYIGSSSYQRGRSIWLGATVNFL